MLESHCLFLRASRRLEFDVIFGVVGMKVGYRTSDFQVTPSGTLMLEIRVKLDFLSTSIVSCHGASGF